MAALAGVVTLGSCVKDDVSGSVEAVRNAKAQELLGRAANENAQAALNNALAATENASSAAKAALAKAQADLAAAQAQSAQAQADLDKAQLASQIEEAISNFQAMTQANKNALDAALRTAMTSKSADVAALLGNYKAAYNKLTAAQSALVAANAALAKAQIDADYAEEVNAALIKGWEDTIAEKEALLEALKEIKAGNLAQSEINATADALTAEADEAAAAFENNPAIDEFVAASFAWVDAYEAYLAFVDPTNGKIAKLNAEATTKVGKAYLTAAAATTDIKKGAINFGQYVDYVYGTGAIVGDPKYTSGNITAATYRVSEEGKLLFDDYIKNFTKTANNNLKAAKDAKADLEGALGTASDTKDSKYKGVVTLYGALNEAKAATAKAEAAEADAKKAMADKPATVEAKYKALLAEVNKKTFKGSDWIAAVVDLADALVAAYGAPAFDPNLKKYDYATAGDADKAVQYLFGAAGKVEADLDDPAEVEALFDNTKATCIVKTWAKDASKKDATEITKVEDIINRDAKAVNVITAYKDAQNATKAAKAAQKTAQTAVDGQPQLIAAAQDNINKAQDAVDNADADLAEVKALVADADLEAYNAAVTALAEASDAFKAAYKKVDDAAFENVGILYAQAAQIAGTTPTSVDNKIAAAEAALANAKANLAKAQSDNYGQDAIVAAAKQAVEDAEYDVAEATAELAAAQKAIEDSGIEFDLDGEEEPAPAPAPAEDETPAEGEGE